MKSPEDKDLRCTACLNLHVVLCDGTRGEQHVAPGVRPIPPRPCRARLCLKHAFVSGDKHFCDDCALENV